VYLQLKQFNTKFTQTMILFFTDNYQEQEIKMNGLVGVGASP